MILLRLKWILLLLLLLSTWNQIWKITSRVWLMHRVPMKSNQVHNRTREWVEWCLCTVCVFPSIVLLKRYTSIMTITSNAFYDCFQFTNPNPFHCKNLIKIGTFEKCKKNLFINFGKIDSCHYTILYMYCIPKNKNQLGISPLWLNL